VFWFAVRAGHVPDDARLRQSMLRLAIAGLVLAAVLWLSAAPVIRWLAGWHGVGDLAALAVLGTAGAVIYGVSILALFGRDWVALFRATSRH
jgi:hypothetical protein